MNKFIFAVLGAACCAMPAAANEVLPSTKSDMTQSASGETKGVVAHGICRQITNNNASPVMIPHRTAEEWSVEENSFLADVRPGLIVQDCPPQPPTSECFFWVTGFIASYRDGAKNYPYLPLAKIGEEADWSNIVGEGEYPDSYGSDGGPGPFYRAAKQTFDGMAIGRRTSIVVYSGKKFSGNVLLKTTGPRVIQNSGFSDDRFSIDTLSPNWINQDWSSGGALFDQFPPSTRTLLPGWTMHPWGYGSVNVTCN
ncbi:hypothetical protein ACN9JG_18690 (plasmid) [Cereibacter azotoformans]|uniref:hypothetical protein n=1 Tax=Cereibacter azotoformans TaxID=43057 RepID=UPI003B217F3B